MLRKSSGRLSLLAMGAVVGDYNNDGWPDLLVTCLGGVVLYRNNGDGTFTDVTKASGLGGDSGWATGAAFGDYDSDGWPICLCHIMSTFISTICLHSVQANRVSTWASMCSVALATEGILGQSLP